MAETIIDKDYLFKTVTRIMGEKMHFTNIQMHQSMNILSTVFSNVNFVSSKNMLSVERCQNSIIIKNFSGCKKMSGVKESSIKQYMYSISSLIKFCNKNLVDITTDDIRRFLLQYEKSVSKITVNNCRRNLNVFFNLWKMKNILKRIL